ncbi:hypothetical protein NL676_003756 [Syzygium grande]|nr:hypothetical protein NL676_003756 [Syzygium grande]
MRSKRCFLCARPWVEGLRCNDPHAANIHLLERLAERKQWKRCLNFNIYVERLGGISCRGDEFPIGRASFEARAPFVLGFNWESDMGYNPTSRILLILVFMHADVELDFAMDVGERAVSLVSAEKTEDAG